MFNKRLNALCLSLPGLLLLAAASYWTVRLSRADLDARSQSTDAVRRATLLVPNNSEYYLQLADLLDSQGGDTRRPLESAVSLNPANASAWIQLGLLAEARTDLPLAEHYLLHAAQVSAQYEPRWTLANYYFRRGQPDAFWHWARLAMEMSYGDRRPLFNLCWDVSHSADEILGRALPDRLEVWRDYLSYLLDERKLDAAQPVAEGILDRIQPGDLPLLLDYDDALLAARRSQPALIIWNRLCVRKLLRAEPLSPERGDSLTNGDFETPFAAGGFDWRAPSTAGVACARGKALFRASLSGRQPETCEILWQYLPVEPRRAYLLNFEYQTEEIQPNSGLQWMALDAAGGAELAAPSPGLSSDSWKPETLKFKTGDSTRLARLVLAYRRSLGTTRIEGAISLRKIAIGFQP